MHINMTIHALLIIFALVFAILSTAAIPSPPRFQWLPASLTFLILAIAFL